MRQAAVPDFSVATRSLEVYDARFAEWEAVFADSGTLNAAAAKAILELAGVAPGVTIGFSARSDQPVIVAHAPRAGQIMTVAYRMGDRATVTTSLVAANSAQMLPLAMAVLLTGRDLSFTAAYLAFVREWRASRSATPAAMKLLRDATDRLDAAVGDGRAMVDAWLCAASATDMPEEAQLDLLRVSTDPDFLERILAGTEEFDFVRGQLAKAD